MLSTGTCTGIQCSTALKPLEFSCISNLKRQAGLPEPVRDKKRVVADGDPGPAAASSSSAPLSGPRAAVQAPQPPCVGNQRLHFSHTLEHKRGIIICQRCGYYTISKAGKLAQPCVPITPGVKSGGRDFLSRWAKDLTPKKSVNWPNTFSYLPDGVIWKSQS